MILHIKVFGRVQGVGFRAWAVRRAEELSLSGWVRNRISGSVEILAEGQDEAAELFLSACRKGPLFARVDRIEAIGVPDAPVLPIETGIFTIQATI
ncbi:MAG: acylphosphatase [Alphaproteobacteria bacterium]|nr:acylphosphatase [Alphaproteobacteria bacterium]